MKYNENDIRRLTGAKALVAGEIYRNQGRVLAFSQDKTGISSKVHGNERLPYVQHIQINNVRGQISIEGDCTCPVGFNCKHVAAALLEGLNQNRSGKGSVSLSAVSLDQNTGNKSSQHSSNEVSLQLDEWISSLEEAQQVETEDYPSQVTGRLIYILLPLEGFNSHIAKLGLKAVTTRILKDGSLSSSIQDYTPQNAGSAGSAKYLRPSDKRICRAIMGLDTYFDDSIYSLFEEQEPNILLQILATGRARWLDVNGLVLTRGDVKSGYIDWEPAGIGAMRPQLKLEGDLVLLNATPPLYVDIAAGLIGEIDTGLQPKIASALLNAPSVPLDQLAVLNDKLMKTVPELVKIHPPKPGPPVFVNTAPVPVLKLFAAEIPVEGNNSNSGGLYQQSLPKERVALARLMFRYDSAKIDMSETRMKPLVAHKGQILEIQRDAKKENAALKTLQRYGFAYASARRSNIPDQYSDDFLPEGNDEEAWFEALHHDIPRLEEQGFEIEFTKSFPIRLLRGDGEVGIEIGESSGIDWLELGIGVMVDGQRIDLVEPLVAMITKDDFNPDYLKTEDAKDEPIYLSLGDGRFIALPPERFIPIINSIYELASGRKPTANGKLQLDLTDAASIGEFEAATKSFGVVWRGGNQIRIMGRKLSASGGIPAVLLPESFKAELRPYQAEGVAWLAFLREVGLGGILADDMGLGKTVQALALLAVEKAKGRLNVPALVVAPTSLMANWRREAEKFTPDLKVLTLQGSDRSTKFGDIKNSDLVLTTYPLIGRDHEVLIEQKWHILFLDEAQTIKNPDAATTKLITGLDARHRFCLTGTPLENHLGELWSLFAFASPGFLGDRAHFTREWRTPIEKRGDSARGQLLAKRVKPFMLRRTKAEVANELPPKTEIIERVEMQPAQSDVYESIRLSMHEKVRAAIAAKGFARSRIVILDALLKLRQTCCDPRLLKLENKSNASAASAKLERLKEMLEELIDEGRKIIVFSQFTSMLDLIRKELDEAQTPYCLLTGKTKDRETEIQRFQEGDIPIFLISLKAGGTGLNLTAADTIILYDPWWNPAVEEQAIDRAHRIGQDKPVFVHKLVMTGTIEEKMEVLKEKKRALAQSIFDPEGSPTLAMTEADLDMLFTD